MKEIENDRLIVRYFTGEATSDEIQEISKLLVSDPEFIEDFEEYRRVWLLTTRQSVASADTEKEWALLADRINNASQAESPRLPSVLVRKLFTLRNIAASLILLIAVSATLLFINSKKQKEFIAEVTGQEITLPDGSTVILREGAKLAYPHKFGKDERKVSLKGEAYFRVTHDAAHPFIVSGGEANIKVLGTEFNVITNPTNNTLNVVLEKGKVSVYLKGKEDNNVLLIPGEQAMVDINTGTIEKTVNNDLNYKSWITREIVFNSSSLSAVSQTLQHVYGQEVRLTGTGSKDCALTATFKDQPLTEVLDVISATLGISVTIKDNVIYLDGNCN